jgi:hypothetical protein
LLGVLWGFLFWAAMPTDAVAQRVINTQMTLSGLNISGNSMQVSYRIPYGGVVEFYVYRADAPEQMWRDQFIYKAPGEYNMVLDTKYLRALGAGAQFVCRVAYKGNEIERTFFF